MPTHVDCKDVVIAGKARREMVERMRDAPDAVQHDERRLVRAAPVQVMNAQAVNGDEPVGRNRRTRLGLDRS